MTEYLTADILKTIKKYRASVDIEEVILHIGFPKTATSSMQESLKSNSCLIKEKGFLFPKDIPSNHFCFLNTIVSNNPEQTFQEVKAERDKRTVHMRLNRLLNRLIKEIRTSNVQKLIISAEGLSLIQEKSIHRCKEFFNFISTKEVNYKIICFVRNPIELYYSHLQQALKKGQKTFDSKKYIISKWLNNINSYKKIFGGKAVYIYSFEDAIIDENGPANFLMKKIGLSFELEDFKNIKTNESLKSEAIYLIEYINYRIPLIVNGQINPKRERNDTILLENIGELRFGENYNIDENILQLINNDIQKIKDEFDINYKKININQKSKIPIKISNKSLEDLNNIYTKLSPVIRQLTRDFIIQESIRIDDVFIKNKAITLVEKIKSTLTESETIKTHDKDKEHCENKTVHSSFDISRFKKIKTNIKEVIIHIGIHKTASSSIQETLMDNHELLLKHGYLYPKSLPSNHSGILANLLKSEPKKYQQNIISNRSEDEIKKRNHRIFETFTQEIVTSDAEKLIISAEYLSIAEICEIKRFKDIISLFTEKNVKCNVICFVRDVVKWNTSSLQQRIRSGTKDISEDPAEIAKDLFRSRLQKFISLFGKEHMKVYKFEEAVQHSLGPVGFFMEKIGVENIVHLENNIFANPSLKHEAVKLLEFINKHEKPYDFENLLYNKNRQHNDTKPLFGIGKEKFILPLDEQGEIIYNARSDILWLNENFGIDYSNVDTVGDEPKDSITKESLCDLEKVFDKLSPTICKLTIKYLENSLNEVNPILINDIESLLVKMKSPQKTGTITNIDADKKGMIEVIIHMGLPKTGTSSIQKTLHTNRDLLIKKGIIYPQTHKVNGEIDDSIINHIHILADITHNEPETFYANTLLEYSREDINKILEQFNNNLISEVKEKNFKKIIISAESISNFNINKLKKMKKYFEKMLGNNILFKIILCVRNPIDWHSSAKQQLIKSGLDSKENLFKHHKNLEDLYRSRIENIEKTFGINSLCVYKFEDAVKDSDGFTQFFFKKMGIANEIIQKMKIEFVNESISAEALGIIEFINKKVPLYINKDINKEAGRKNLDTRPIESIGTTKYSISYKEMKEIQEKAKSDVEWLKQHTKIDYTEYKVEQDNSLGVVMDADLLKQIDGIKSDLSDTIKTLLAEYLNENEVDNKANKKETKESISIEEVFIHIGTSKTGTSSIQSTLRENKSILKRNGVLYPDTYPHHSINHMQILNCLFNNDAQNHYINAVTSTTNEDVLNIAQNFTKSLGKEVVSQKFSSVIISSEDLPLYSRENLKDIKEYVYKHISEKAKIKIIMYIRNPVDWSVSLLQQNIKSGVDWRKFKINRIKSIKRIYILFIEKFFEIFGKENVFVYSFEDAISHDMSITGHFLSKVGLNEEIINQFKLKRVNESISSEAIDIIAYINDRCPLFIDGKINASGGRIHQDTALVETIGETKFKADALFRKEIFENASESIEWLKNNVNIDYSKTPDNIEENIEVLLTEDVVIKIRKILNKVTLSIKKYIFEYLAMQLAKTLDEKVRKVITEILEESEKYHVKFESEKPYNKIVLNDDSIDGNELSKTLLDLYAIKGKSILRMFQNTVNYSYYRFKGFDSFDGEFYTQKYQKGTRWKLPPLLHYMTIGAYLGLNPSDKFNTAEFVLKNPDIIKFGYNPLIYELKKDKFQRRESR
jgi:hypothetical protein